MSLFKWMVIFDSKAFYSDTGCFFCLLQLPRSQTKLSTMLEKLGMKYEGRPHCGLDDSRNIARIAVRMLQDGCQLRVNERMHAGQLLAVPSSAPVEGAPPPHTPGSRN